MASRRIAVIGAGLMGSVIALELALRGERVIVLDRNAAPMSGASLHNEGKIHLGFVYALDPTGATRRHMLEGALSFGPILDRLCGPQPWGQWRSEGFRYAVMPGSLAAPDELEDAYADVQRQFAQVWSELDHPVHYVGTQPHTLWKRSGATRGRPVAGGAAVRTLYETSEVAIDPRSLAATITDRLRRDPRIDLRCGTTVTTARRTAAGSFDLSVRDMHGPHNVAADIVVNCSWGDRQRLDEAVGQSGDDRTWSYRTKYSIIVRPPHDRHGLAPVTMVQGPFGDVVPWLDGTVYISWYPVARTYFGRRPPGPPDDASAEARRVAHASLAALAEMFPALEGSDIISSRRGLIVAEAETDVDDPTSSLHTREEAGASNHAGWWTVAPAKLTTAPLIGHRTAVRIAEEAGVGVA